MTLNQPAPNYVLIVFMYLWRWSRVSSTMRRLHELTSGLSPLRSWWIEMMLAPNLHITWHKAQHECERDGWHCDVGGDERVSLMWQCGNSSIIAVR